VAASAVPLVGIARSAAEGQVLVQKRQAQYRTLAVKNWISRCDSPRVPFDWTLNPYRGCEFGCKYCYARYTHEFLNRWDTAAFEREIYVKDWNADQFRAELEKVGPGQSLALGSATDPYQPVERQAEVTRKILQVLATTSGRRIYLTTKSALVARDVALWKEVAAGNQVSIGMSVPTADRTLARALEPYAPRPDLRLGAVRELAEAGLQVTVMASPVLPLITDGEENLQHVAELAKEAGAAAFEAHVLFLTPSSLRVFFPFLRDQFPHLLKRYQASYGGRAYLEGAYPERIQNMVEAIRERTGLGARGFGEMALPETPQNQLPLF
jgi:DNA repair photolyase